MDPEFPREGARRHGQNGIGAVAVRPAVLSFDKAGALAYRLTREFHHLLGASPSPHSEITADWSVSDSDGNLATVTVEAFGSKGSLVESVSNSVSGSSASGTDHLKIKHANNQTFDVVGTVADDGGKSVSQIKSVTE